MNWPRLFPAFSVTIETSPAVALIQI